MSETIVEDKPLAEEQVSIEDLRRMLGEKDTKLAEIERERDDERRRRVDTERERDESVTHVQSEAERRYAAEVAAAEAALSAARSEADRAEDAYVAAIDAGDSRAAAKAQRAISVAEGRALQEEQRKKWLDTNKETLVRPQQQQAPKASAGRYAEFVGGALLPAEETWLDDRPQFKSDAKYRAKVIGASQIAGAEFTRGSGEYLERMAEILGEKRAPVVAPAAPVQERSRSADIPPARRQQPGAEPAGGREVRLTADEAEVADSMYGNPSGPDYIADQGERYRKYAANRDRMKAAGRL